MKREGMTDGYSAIPVEHCVLQTKDIETLAALLGIDDHALTEVLASELNYYGTTFLRWRRQELAVLSRKSQTLAIDVVSAAAESLTKALENLDVTAEGTLMDALSELPVHRIADIAPEDGFEQLQQLRDRVIRTRTAAMRVKAQLVKQKGPPKATTVPMMVFHLADYYAAFRQRQVTHSTLDGIPTSKAGEFIVSFFEAVDRRAVNKMLSRKGLGPVPPVSPNEVSSSLAAYVKRHQPPTFPVL
jgi:hypothetical protein